MATARRFVLVAGEASGDRLGQALIAALRQRYPNASFAGVGGAGMRAEGLDCWHDCAVLSVMGLAEVLAHLPRLLALRRGLRRRVLADPPDAFIGIDSPDFNLPLERRLRARGVTTVHYVSPSVWAWRPGRARTIGRSTDLVLTLFPFEPANYHAHGAAAEYVGHPAADAIPLKPDRALARRELGIPGGSTAVALLPGSRVTELKRLGRPFARAAARIAAVRPDVKFVVPCATAATRRLFERALARHAPGLDVRLHDGRAWEVLTAAEVALIASGTAALEAMLCKTPMVVAYRISPLTHFIVKRLGLLKIERYALPNVLAGDSLVPELMQSQANPSALAASVLRLLGDDAARAALRARFEELHRGLEGGGGERAAAAIAALVERR